MGVSSCPSNIIYPTVRDLLAKLELDLPHVGTEAWNPLGILLSKGSVSSLSRIWCFTCIRKAWKVSLLLSAIHQPCVCW